MLGAKVQGRFDSHGVRNPQIQSISSFGKNLPKRLPRFPRHSPQARGLPKNPGNRHSLVELSDKGRGS